MRIKLYNEGFFFSSALSDSMRFLREDSNILMPWLCSDYTGRSFCFAYYVPKKCLNIILYTY